MWHSQGASQQRLDGAWSFKPFVLLSLAIPSGFSLLGKECQQVRFCFPNTKLMPVLPSLPSLCLAFFFFSLFPSLSFPFLLCPLLPFLLLFWEEEGSTCHSSPL